MNWLWKLLQAGRFVPALMALALTLTASRADAASRAETNSWNEILHLASEDAVAPIMWGMVANKCEEFLKHFPNSERGPDALGIEARALFNQTNYAAVIDKLSTPPANMSKAADQFAYWTARAYFEKKNYKAAAENFARLNRDYPSSTLRLEAIYREGEAHAKLEEWPRVIEELREPDGPFQQIARATPNDEWVVSAFLLLSEAELSEAELRHRGYEDARKTLMGIAPQALRPELEWERQFLLCRVQLADGHAKEALASSTNLLAAAMGNLNWKAKSLILKGEIYEGLGQTTEAVQTYEANLGEDLPADRRREALLRIVELTLRQNKAEEAAQKLIDYLVKYPDEKSSDFEWLVLGELHLKEDYLAQEELPVVSGQGTNLLQLAEENFTKIIKGFTNSEYVGKAELNLGWCYAQEGKLAESLEAFSNAVVHLPFSEDRAVARFKLADTYFLQTNFVAAISNYTALIEQYGSAPAVRNELFEQALYQIVRAGLAETNMAVATNAMTKIIEWFPNGLLADRSMLLVGQGQNPAEARKVFTAVASRSPQSSLLPEIQLAVARTYEKETNWLAALTQYDTWVNTYTNHPALPRAEFSLAWSTYQAGNESNAFFLFTNFVTRFQSNILARSFDLPAQAQYWVGDYYWRQGEFQMAEISYKEIFDKWSNSSLALPAKMMAGRAALAGQRAQTATNYFTSLLPDPNSSMELKSQAAFALADATLTLQLPLASEPAKYSNAIEVLYYIATDPKYTNTAMSARAWGRLGACYYALAGDDASRAATNAAARDSVNQRYIKADDYFEKAMDSEQADATTRSLAEFRLGKTLESMARLQTPCDQALCAQALDHYFNVMDGDNLRDNEQADWFCVKESGLEAAKLSEDLGEWKQARQIYQKLVKLMPPLQSAMEKKIARTLVQETGATEKK